MRSLRQIGKKRKNIKYSFIFVLSTLVIISIIFFTGIKILVYTINFISDFKHTGTLQENSDTLPPKIPDIYPFNQYTNLQNIIIKGEAEPSSTVILIFNNQHSEKIADSEGNFLFDVSLNEGENSFFLYSKDTSGNESSKTKLFTIIKDTSKPNLVINQPIDRSVITGIENINIEIKGSTEIGVELKINDKFVNVNDNGDFIYKYKLKSGENIINISAKDQAGNETIKQLFLTYQE